MEIEKDINYLEGKWIGTKLSKVIHCTEYKTIKDAIVIKTDLINQFEKKFNYSRKMNINKFDPNYSYNVGMLDAFLEKQKEDGS